MIEINPIKNKCGTVMHIKEISVPLFSVAVRQLMHPLSKREKLAVS